MVQMADSPNANDPNSWQIVPYKGREKDAKRVSFVEDDPAPRPVAKPAKKSKALALPSNEPVETAEMDEFQITTLKVAGYAVSAMIALIAPFQFALGAIIGYLMPPKTFDRYQKQVTKTIDGMNTETKAMCGIAAFTLTLVTFPLIPAIAGGIYVGQALNSQFGFSSVDRLV